jgi:hypothetical protein
MKALFLSLSVLISAHLVANELNWVDEQVEAIKPPRAGMKSREISSLKDPFIFLKKNKPKKSSKAGKKPSNNGVKKIVKAPISFKLYSIINKSALVNGKWYKEGEIIHGYKIAEINPQSVLLTKRKKKLLLSTQSRNQNLNFNNK